MIEVAGPSGRVHTRVLSFAGSSVQIEAVGDIAATLVAFLFDDLPAAAGTAAPHVTLRADASDPTALTLSVDGRLYCQVDTPGGLGSALVGQALFHLSDRSTGGLLLHAAAVARDGRCVVLPGTTGAGKSSLTAWLLRQGFEYLTDELVYIPLGSLAVKPFVRPLNLKASARAHLGADVIDFDAAGSAILHSPDISLVPVSTLGRIAAPAEAHLEAIAFPRFVAAGQGRIERLTAAETGMGLMGALINARNLPQHGFGDVSRVARMVPAWRLEYGHFEQIEAWAASILG